LYIIKKKSIYLTIKIYNIMIRFIVDAKDVAKVMEMYPNAKLGRTYEVRPFSNHALYIGSYSAALGQGQEVFLTERVSKTTLKKYFGRYVRGYLAENPK
jgi:hypothetical protein